MTTPELTRIPTAPTYSSRCQHQRLVGYGICLVAFVLLLCLTSQSQAAQEIDLAQLLATCEDNARKVPGSIEVRLALGFAYLAVDALAEADQAFQAVQQLAANTYDGYYWSGRTRLLQERYQASIPMYQQALLMEPDRSDAYADMGLSYFRLHQYEAARSAFDDALSLPPAAAPIAQNVVPSLFESPTSGWLGKVMPLSRADVCHYLGLIAVELNEREKASEYFQQAHNLRPSAQTYFQLGLLSAHDKRWNDAQEAFLASIHRDPLFAQSHYQLALVYFRQGKTTEATAAMGDFQRLKKRETEFQEERKSLLRNVDKSHALIKLGWLYVMEEKYDEAAREYQKAVWHDPKSPNAYNGLAHVYALQGRFEEATRVQEKALALNPDMAECHAGVGFIQRKQAEVSQSRKGYEAALAAYRKATELKPEFTEAHLSRGLLALQLSYLEEAEKAFMTLLSLSTNDDSSSLPDSDLSKVHLALGQVCLRQKQLQRAVRHYEKALEYDADAVEAYYSLGFLTAKAGRSDEAIKHYRAVLLRKPDMAEAYYQLGRLYTEKAEYAKAEDAYRNAIKFRPSLAGAHERLAHLYGTQGIKSAEALALAQKAVELHPSSAAYLNTLSWLYYLQRDYLEAEQALKKALALDPDNPLYQQGLEAVQQAREATDNRTGQ